MDNSAVLRAVEPQEAALGSVGHESELLTRKNLKREKSAFQRFGRPNNVSIVHDRHN